MSMTGREKVETLTIEEIRSRLSHEVDEESLPVLIDGLAVLGKGRNLFGIAVKTKSPYRLPGLRFGLLTRGSVDLTLNLITRHVEAPSLAFFGDGSILQLEEVASESEVQGLMVEPGLLQQIFPHQPPSAFNGQLQDFFVPVETDRREQIECLFRALSLTVNEAVYNREVAQHLIAALVHAYSEAYEVQADKPQNACTRERELFNRFIHLVNEHGKRQHTLDFYADRLCITQRYLSRVVQQVSDVHAKEWIDRALITEAKVMLKHSSRPVAAIAEELHFANPSFFNKFFKRLVGVTPNAFRNG